MLSRLFALAVAALAASTSSAEVSYHVIPGEIASEVSPDGSSSFEMAVSIAAATSKSLIFTLASEINLVTQTAAKGGNGGGKDTSEASAGMSATIKYCVDCEDEDAGDVCSTDNGSKIDGDDSPTVYEAAPGPITMSARKQTLSVTTDLTCTCEVEGDLDCDCSILGYVEVDLTLDTTAAHSFTWIAELRDTTGTGSTNKPIRAVACFQLDADAEADLGNASAAVTLGSTVFVATEAQPSKLREEI